MKSLSSSPSATTSNILLSPYKNNIDSLHEIPTSQYHFPLGLSKGWTENVTIVMYKSQHSLHIVQFLTTFSYNLTTQRTGPKTKIPEKAHHKQRVPPGFLLCPIR